MFKMNKKIEYALIALKHMHFKDTSELSTAKEIAQKYHAPFDVTSRVLQLMAARGWLKSEQGAHGGYHIVTDLEAINFLELVECLIGSVHMANCLDDERTQCDQQESCNIMSPLTWLNGQLKNFCASLSVKEILSHSVTANNGTASTMADEFFV